MKKILTTLSPQHRMFVESYNGDSMEAAKLAGFSGEGGYLKKKGDELLMQPLIVEAIKARSQYLVGLKGAVATREERQAFWTSLMRNNDPYAAERVDPSTNAPVDPEELTLTNRIKASEILGRSEADFIDNVNMNMKADISQLIMGSYPGHNGGEDLSIEAIEAEYTRSRGWTPAPIEPPKPITPALPEISAEDLI